MAGLNRGFLFALLGKRDRLETGRSGRRQETLQAGRQTSPVSGEVYPHGVISRKRFILSRRNIQTHSGIIGKSSAVRVKGQAGFFYNQAMRKLISFGFAAASCAVLLTAAPARAQYYFDAEGGSVRAGHNTIKVPLEGGTRFSLTDELKSEAAPYARLRVGRRWGKSDLSFLAAPLTLRSSGRLDKPVNFDGASFPGGVPVEAVYRFNSYRVKYLYEFHRTGKLALRWGGALKLRHAGVTLSGGGGQRREQEHRLRAAGGLLAGLRLQARLAAAAGRGGAGRPAGPGRGRDGGGEPRAAPRPAPARGLSFPGGRFGGRRGLHLRLAELSAGRPHLGVLAFQKDMTSRSVSWRRT